MKCLRCELQGLAPADQPTISVFFHVAALPETANVLTEQLRAIRESGLLEWTADSYATLAGWDGSCQLRAFRRQLTDVGFNQVAEEPDLKKWEFPTTRALWLHCRQMQSSKAFVLYLHTKGASKPADPDADWRRELMSFAVVDWRLRVRELDSGRLTSGARYVPWGCGHGQDYVQAHGHYSGNIWWAASDYVSWLPDPEQFGGSPPHRFSAEAWIGQHSGVNRLRSELNT
jgi:hypothetical protein